MNINFKINISEFLIFITIFACFKITILSYISSIFTLFYLILQIIVSILSIYKVFKKNGIQMIDGLTITFCIIGLISTLFNHLSIQTWLRETIPLLALVYSARWMIQLDGENFINYTARYTGILTIINTITAMITYPNALVYDGMNPVFFIGGDNTSVRIYIIAVLFAVLAVNKHLHSKVYLFLMLMNFIIFSFVRDLGTGKLCVFILVIGILIFLILKVPIPKKSIKKVGIMNIIIFILLVLESNIKIFSYIIITLLNRDLTLTTRTLIWEVTLNKIKERPFIGNGYVSGQQFEAMLPHIIGVNAHNTFLMVVFTGGILLLIVFIWLYIIAQKKYDDHYLIMHIIPIVLMVMMLRAQVEGGDIIYIIYICHLIYMSPYINKVIDRRFKILRYSFK